ncbi:hypothetical protein ACLMAJ_03185 [Nocardia sp. KC 131]|uniref:hypothetical protein n=1 Tax=Nocardia arseniciresistens TaxID=3392119 RepID=UPI00398F4AD9
MTTEIANSSAVALKPQPVSLFRHVVAGTGPQSMRTPHGYKRGTVMSEPRRLTQDQREDFWRRCGWSPELPTPERLTIETRWDDESIDMAELFGW